MDQWLVLVDDAEHALHLLQPLLQAPGRRPTQWLLLACPPRATQLISRWVTHSARARWRGKWADKTLARLTPVLTQSGDQVQLRLGCNPLHEQTDLLLREFGPAQLLDARRYKPGHEAAPAMASRAPANPPSLLAVTGMGLLLVGEWA